ncbi:hypothetical protein L6R50_05135 [Myxococcota bacterium]|nr:hypothetical protein [Myxococcota bacterium]
MTEIRRRGDPRDPDLPDDPARDSALRSGPPVEGAGDDIATVRMAIDETRWRLRQDVTALEAALRDRLDPRVRIRRSPWAFLAGALLVGLLVGLARRQRGAVRLTDTTWLIGPPRGPWRRTTP